MKREENRNLGKENTYSNEREQLEKEIRELEERAEIERLRKRRDELRGTVAREVTGNRETGSENNEKEYDKEDEYIEDDREYDENKGRKALRIAMTAGLSLLVLFLIAFIGIAGFKIIDNMTGKEERKEQKVVQEQDGARGHTASKGNVEVVVSRPNNGLAQGKEIVSVQPEKIPEGEINQGELFETKSTRGPVNIRERPTRSSKIIDELQDGIILEIVRREGSWYYVSYVVEGSINEGYVHKSQIRKKV